MWQEQNHPVLRSLVWLSEGAGRIRATGSTPAATVWNSGARLMQPGRLVVDRKEYEKTAAEWVSSAINRAVEARGRCSIGLVGGSTPEPVYRCLAREPFRKAVRWDALWVYFGD